MAGPGGAIRRHRTQSLLALLAIVAIVAAFVAFRALGRSSSALPPPLAPLSETPGSATAILFTTTAKSAPDLAYIRAQLVLQHYSVGELTEANGGATASNFKSALRARRGILFASGDGGPDFFGVQVLADAASCARAVSAYQAG